MQSRSLTSLIAITAMLSACGGGGTGGGSGSVSVAAPTPTPVATSAAAPTASASCSLRERQDWVSAQMREWYLFPETLPVSLDPAPFTSVETYLDALTATARSQRRDRFFTYITSIASENAFFSSGQTAGFGFRLSTNAAQRRVFIAESFEGAPALAAGIDRGAEITAIGTSAANLRTVSDILGSEGSQGITNALGPNTPGTTRSLRVVDASGTRVVSVAKADYELTPVSSRYGSKIIDDGGKKVGYVNLRTFISTADDGLRAAFASFRAAGITQVVIDLRYNGGGLVSTAEVLNDLLGRARTANDVQGFTTFRPEKASSSRTRNYQQVSQSIAPTRIAFIGTGGTASASELVINAQIPYLRANAALIGTNTFGKPVGQIALDRAGCDDRLRVTAFAVQNSARSAAYFDGLAGTVEASCQAVDDISRPLGDPQEASMRGALDYLAGRTCTPISAVASSARSSSGTRELLSPERPDAAQREVPGAF